MERAVEQFFFISPNPSEVGINQYAYENVQNSVWKIFSDLGAGTGFFYIS